MSNMITDGSWAIAFTGPPRFSAPIDGVNTNYLLAQDCISDVASFARTALDTAHPEYPTFYLVAESEPQPTGLGALRWTRTYSAVPANHTDYETFTATFPGFFTIYGLGIMVGRVEGREIVTKNVNSQVLSEYFLCKTGQTYSTPGAIPQIYAEQYYVGTPAVKTEYLTDDSYVTFQSVPSRETYEGWISDGAANGWSATKKLVAEDSKLSRWMGNIYVRKTRYVLAQ